MDFILNNWKVISPILISVLVGFFTTRYNGKLKKHIQELDREFKRKSELSEPQDAILFIVQNMIGKRIKMEKDKENDIESKMMKIMKHKSYIKIFNVELFAQAQFALYSEISLSTRSQKVMAIVLRIQERAYEIDKINDKHSPMILYSILYKYLYLEFTNNKIDDFYLLRCNLTDFYDHVDILEEKKKEIYVELENKNNWKELKN